MTHPTADRLARLRARMKETATGLVAVAPGSHMDWLLGFHPHPDERPCLLLVGERKETFLMPVLNAEGSRESTDISFFTWADAEGPNAALAAALADIEAGSVSKVALDETMRADFALLLLGMLPDARHAFTGETLGALRMKKDTAEFVKLKMNAGIADRAMQKAFASIRPGMTELELAAVIKDHFASEGAMPAFWIVGAGGNGAFPHHQTGQRKLEEGDAIVIDIGGRKAGFPSDITRMRGGRARDADAAARNVIADAGYGEFFVHRTGHGMGIDGHEPPYITSASDTVLEEGMVFSIEPGIYLPGRFGIRLEEIVILRDDGPEILSSLPRDLHVART